MFDRDGEVFATNIANVGVEKDFNRVDLEGHPVDALETTMAEFDSLLGPALQRIEQAANLDNQDDRGVLLNFIGLASLRNPRMREIYRDFNERLMKATMRQVMATKDRWEALTRDATAAGYFEEAPELTYEQMREFIERDSYKIILNNEMYLTAEFKGFDSILPFLFNRRWWLLRAPDDSQGFVSSDCPACLMFSDPEKRGGRPGHGTKGTQLVFPVTARLAVAGAFELREGANAIPAQAVADFNATVISYAERQVYSRDGEAIYTFAEGRSRRIAELPNDLKFLRERAEK